MIRTLWVCHAQGADPYTNLALEQGLLRAVSAEECILYLWQNERTVVIGRNQNAAAECRLSALEADGGHLARRLSGGGAVYHDLGNLNFTFLMPTEEFDLARQTQVIMRAVRACGIDAQVSGRNDLTVDGKKFSGHAYCHRGGRSFHHGTLMLRVDQARLERYLSVSPLKLEAKSVPSVRARVGNLADWSPSLTVGALKEALTEAFEMVYGLRARPFPMDALDAEALARERERFASPEWKYGRYGTYEASREARFPWGTVRVDFTLRDGCFAEAALWSDGLDAEALSRIPALLRGVRAEESSVRARLEAALGGGTRLAEDMAALLTRHDGCP